MRPLVSAVILSTIIFIDPLFADESKRPEESWGLVGAIRSGSIPYEIPSELGGDSDTVTSFVPMLFFDNDYFYIDGLEGGIKLYKDDDWRISALIRHHFIDIPADIQNQVQADTADWGAQLRYYTSDNTYLDTEFLADFYGNTHGNLRLSYWKDSDKYSWKVWTQAHVKSADYNTEYYTFKQDDESINGGIDLSVGVRGKYHLISNLYAVGQAEIATIDSDARASQAIDATVKTEVWAGVGFFNETATSRKSHISNRPYLRLAHTFATPSDLSEIIRFDMDEDEYHNKMTSLFYGHPLTDSLFGLPLDVYLTPGFSWHYSSEVQPTIQELVIAVKLFYTIPTPWRIRLGVAEGMSYVTDITYIERHDKQGAAKGYEPSQFLNYLDFTIGMNVGDIFDAKKMKDTWAGVDIHHRSAIFETAQQYGRLKGGSNYVGFFIKQHFD